jgi:hypothetical protein
MIRITNDLGYAQYLWKRNNGRTALTGHTGIPFATSNLFREKTAELEMKFEDARDETEMLAVTERYLAAHYKAETVPRFVSKAPEPTGRITVIVTDAFGNRGFLHRQVDGLIEYRSPTGVNLGLPGKDSFPLEMHLANCHTPQEMRNLLEGRFKSVELLEKDIIAGQQLQETLDVLAGLVNGSLDEQDATDFIFEAGYSPEVEDNSEIGTVRKWIDEIANGGASRAEAADYLLDFGIVVDPVSQPTP